MEFLHITGKKINGRKRQVLVDTQGLVLGVQVDPAAMMDRAGVIVLLEAIAERFPRLCHV